MCLYPPVDGRGRIRSFLSSDYLLCMVHPVSAEVTSCVVASEKLTNSTHNRATLSALPDIGMN